MASPTRKRVADDDHAATSKSSKRQRSKQKLPADGEARDDFDGGAEKIAEVGRKKTQQQEEPETPFGKMDGQLIADYMARQIKRFEPDLSVVELEDRRVPASAILDTSDFDSTRDLVNLPAFVEKFTAKSRQTLSKSAVEPGAPHTLVVACAGLRAAELTRALRVYQTKTATVAKLFAKHIKISEAVEFAKKTRMSIGVGTPQRIIDLATRDALSFAKVKHIIIDGSYTNEKKRSIFSMGEIEQALAHLLAQPALKERYGEKVKVIVY